MKEKIYQLLGERRDVLLVGKADSGKTYFIINQLIPFLESKGKKVQYYKDLNEVIASNNKDILILDETEVLDDKEFLENLHPNEVPYYTDLYLNKVRGWLDKIYQITNPMIFVVTRNEDVEIDNLQKLTDISIGKSTEVIKFI